MTSGDTVFNDREDAASRLISALADLPLRNPVVFGLPRGGVPIAAAVARSLRAPLDVIVVRKLGVPWQPEVAMGAIGEGEVRVLDDGLVDALRLRPSDVIAVEARERVVLDARVAALRRDRAFPSLDGRTAVIADDGIATGSTARAACLVARAHGAQRIVIAAPVAAPGIASRLPEADAVVCARQPPGFRAVGQYYRDFSEVTDEEVVAALSRGR
ncbi:phosphoribosyltransferase [Zhihengliuella sp. ISTPL4]|uniref:phosphoribosyltransferase n=1 Tax=Zhihengliuella sp. ISTPL4 TaxID=2058657 RepID=UPI000C7986CB|nr:phosphoribosyltransferase family protein [Zhihengliuella sp. ISTPL4]